jgi:hypothetical protein
VLGGAMSPVLAQAATTRNFNVQDEIEVKDDLDNKPEDDETKSFSDSLESYFADLEHFILNLQKLRSIEKFDPDYDKFALETIKFVPCDVNGDPIAENQASKSIDNHWLEPAITDVVYKLEDTNSLSDCLPSNKFGKHKATNSGIRLSYDKDGLKVEISGYKSSPQKSKRFVERFNQVLKNYDLAEDEIIVGQIYKYTSIKSENNQVLIVTRLPRGSLDELLKQDAKANE